MTQQADTGTPEMPEIDFERITAEIHEEVRRRRANGDFPPGLERELDEVFSRYAPVGDTTGGYEEAIDHADTLSYVHVDVPVASNAPLVPYVKLLFKKVLGWYLRFLAQQTTSFGTAIVRAVRLLGDRVVELERAVPAADPALAVEVRTLTGPPALESWTPALVGALTGTKGRVLVAEAGDATVIDALAGAGVDAYGVDPDSDLVLAAAGRGLDVRMDSVLDHLRTLRDGVLAGIVLAGCVDRFPLVQQRELVQLSAAKVRAGGFVAVAGMSPERWARRHSPVAADLAAGRPLHAETWVHLLAAAGCADVAVEHAPAVDLLSPLPDGAASADVHNANLARLNEVLFAPPAYLITGRTAGRS